jgi:hypothetical protein
MPLSVMGKRTPRCGLEEAPASIEKMSRPRDDPPEGWNLGHDRCSLYLTDALIGWRDQGKRDEARDLLAPVYGWFTEG